MKLRDLFSDDATIDPRAAAIEVTGLAARQPRGEAGRSVLRARRHQDRRRALHRCGDCRRRGGGCGRASAARRTAACRSSPRPIRAARWRWPRRNSYPRQPATIAAVTGTSGKTSVAAFTRQIWQRLGHASASIGTIGLVSPKRTVYGSLTTPDPIALHRQLDEIAREGVTHLALEASSHGLDQYRLDGVRIAAGGFTNLSRDHMDYHPDVAHYLAAKLRLFRDLVVAGGAAVISADHDCSQAVIEAARAAKLADRHGRPQRRWRRRGHSPGRRRRSTALRRSSTLEHRGRRHAVRLPLVGEFQIENALVAAGLAIGTGSEPDAVFAALEHLEGAKGRLERVGEHNGAPIFVDYAHKPDALAKALQALRPYAKRRLVVVFGAGGDRDAGKRPLMGAIAAENADSVIVTDDNPRSENPAAIRAAILAPRRAPAKSATAPRRSAPRSPALQPGDALLIAGKGHETGQIVGDRVLPFSDHDAVAAALAPRVA